MIITEYGKCAHGFIVGGGYGKRDDLAMEADRLAQMLVDTFDLPVQKRGNSDGYSCGAYHDRPAEPGRLWGDTVFGLSARVQFVDNGHRHCARVPLVVDESKPPLYSALFYPKPGERPYLYQTFATAEEALACLKCAMEAMGKRGYKYCQLCGGDTRPILDGEAWCDTCQRYQ